MKTRPIVSFPGSLFHSLGVWIDTHLQEVAKSFRSYIDSSFELVKELKKLRLPPNARVFTSDAKSMYTNINTTAAIKAIEDYITKNQSKFPYLPVTPLIQALEIIMTNNIFQFGDTVWKQNDGTAMGAPPAPTYANASFATHEDSFLDKYNKFLLFYKRYIDDIFGIWVPSDNSNEDALAWDNYKKDLDSFHGLK